LELFNNKKVKVAETMVDEDRYYDLLQGSWYLSNGYAEGRPRKGEKKVSMHRYIMKCKGKMQVDHIDRDKLDNRTSQLRIVPGNLNNRNKSSVKGSTSEYIGVSWNTRSKKWISAITVDYERIYLGIFENEIEAAKARDVATKKYHGQWGCLNFK
jgi:hypothetical protein